MRRWDDIVDGEVETWIQPQPGNPLRFAGRVYVLVGSATYSCRRGLQQRRAGFRIRQGMPGCVATACAPPPPAALVVRHCRDSGLIVVSPRFALTRRFGKGRGPPCSRPTSRLHDLPQCVWRSSKEKGGPRGPPLSPLHAENLLQGVRDLDEIALCCHHRVDVLVRGRRFVDDVLVLAALDARRRGLVVRDA